jgi:hypothetical protein
MNHRLNKLFLAALLTVLFLFSINPLLAQGDNPLIDSVPLEWIQTRNPSPPELDVITTSDGFDNFNLGTDFAEPHVTQNPNNPLQYFGAYNINGAWYTNNGHDWTAITPNFGTPVNGDPVTAYDNLGNLFYESMYGSIVGCRVLRSTDNGANWGTSVISVAGFDKNWMAADQTGGPNANYVYTTMTPGNFARTTNNGTSWTTTATFATQSLPGMMVCVGPNGATNGGAVYVVTNSGSSFASTYTFYASTNGGTSFTFKSAQSFANYVGTNVNGRNSVENMRTRPYPFIAADNSSGTYRGRLYCVYASNTPSGDGNKPDIFCRYSTNQGTTWSSAIIINDDANTTDHHQWHPSIWCDISTGRLFVKWMDTRDTPTSDSAYIYASYSDDGGTTWAANQRISNSKMRINCTTCGGGGTPRYQGDYDAIVSINNQALAMWTDFRAGSFGSYVGYFPDFSMLVSPSTNTLNGWEDSTYFSINVPEVKLYSSDAIFSATVSPTPSTGTISLDFPSGNILNVFPGNKTLRVRTIGSVTPYQEYTISIQGNGPNGTPVHRRIVTIDVIDPLPVELSSFEARYVKDKVILDWETKTEISNFGFDIERTVVNINGNSDAERFASWESLAFIEGNGNSNSPKQYSYKDANPVGGSAFAYRLKQIDTDGRYEYSDIVEIEIIPQSPVLFQNYPNPFNPVTKIKYRLPQASFVSIKVYDVLGNFVGQLVNEEKSSGTYEVEFSATGGNAINLSSGVYFYALSAGDFFEQKKMVVLK